MATASSPQSIAFYLLPGLLFLSIFSIVNCEIKRTLGNSDPSKPNIVILFADDVSDSPMHYIDPSLPLNDACVYFLWFELIVMVYQSAWCVSWF